MCVISVRCLSLLFLDYECLFFWVIPCFFFFPFSLLEETLLGPSNQPLSLPIFSCCGKREGNPVYLFATISVCICCYKWYLEIVHNSSPFDPPAYLPYVFAFCSLFIQYFNPHKLVPIKYFQYQQHWSFQIAFVWLGGAKGSRRW